MIEIPAVWLLIVSLVILVGGVTGTAGALKIEEESAGARVALVVLLAITFVGGFFTASSIITIDGLLK